jgi:hypothetical protein
VQGAQIAEQIQQRMPGQGIEVVSPRAVIGLRSGISTDGTQVALIFQTTEGVPIEVTMPPNLAHETIERLSLCR